MYSNLGNGIRDGRVPSKPNACMWLRCGVSKVVCWKKKKKQQKHGHDDDVVASTPDATVNDYRHGFVANISAVERGWHRGRARRCAAANCRALSSSFGRQSRTCREKLVYCSGALPGEHHAARGTKKSKSVKKK